MRSFVGFLAGGIILFILALNPQIFGEFREHNLGDLKAWTEGDRPQGPLPQIPVPDALGGDRQTPARPAREGRREVVVGEHPGVVVDGSDRGGSTSTARPARAGGKAAADFGAHAVAVQSAKGL